jgi:drug/metabolite transporter (DMT)-like permease
MTSSNNLRAILAMVVSMGSFVASDSCMKLALPHAPLFELMLMRGLVSLAVCLGLILVMGQQASIVRMFDKWLVARGVLETIANADLTAIVQTCPLFVLLGAWAFRGERLGGLRVGLILLGIAGAMLVAQPGTGAVSPLAGLAFLTAIASAVRDLLTPNVPRGMPPLVAALTVIAVLTLTGLVGMLAFETPVMPGSREVLLMVLSGTMAVSGHLLLYLTYRLGEARTVAPFMYTLTIWAVLSGLVVFGEVPNMLAIAGMVLVALSGLAIIWLDDRQRKQEARLAVES